MIVANFVYVCEEGLASTVAIAMLLVVYKVVSFTSPKSFKCH